MTGTIQQLAVAGLFILSLAHIQQSPTANPKQGSQVPVVNKAGKDLNAQQAQQFIQANPSAIVLDVRTPEEYTTGHIDKAKNVNIYDATFVNKLAALDRSKTYVVHCAVGGRSRKAVAVMDSLGFLHVHHLNGGFTAWKQAGQPIVKQN